MMRLTVAAIGRLPKRAPERALIDDYRIRFDRTGRALGLGPLVENEVEPRRNAPGQAAEAEALARAIPEGSAVVVLDERGRDMTSPDLAKQIAGLRDTGRRELSFLIGGADGLAPETRESADLILSLGRMVWPHMLVRVMLFEQLYRAATILAGSPYHRS
jgi:23S rRNA (pseudouridine1915-N3)-methyltransferase